MPGIDKPDWALLTFIYSLLMFSWVKFTANLFWGRCWPYIQRFREIHSPTMPSGSLTLFIQRASERERGRGGEGRERAREHQPAWEEKTEAEKGIHAERKPESEQQTLCHLESGGPITPAVTVSTESAL